MTISLEGASAKIEARAVLVPISGNHPLIGLANTLPWKTLMDQCAEDLKLTTPKGFWWTGRKSAKKTNLAVFFSLAQGGKIG